MLIGMPLTAILESIHSQEIGICANTQEPSYTSKISYNRSSRNQKIKCVLTKNKSRGQKVNWGGVCQLSLNLFIHRRSAAVPRLESLSNRKQGLLHNQILFCCRGKTFCCCNFSFATISCTSKSRIAKIFCAKTQEPM